MAQTLAKKASNAFVWVILALLLVALAGFGITSFTGGASVVGRVGDAEITADDYARALQTELNAQSAQLGQPFQLSDLRAFGLDQAVLEGLVARAALSNEAAEMGLSVGDEEVARQITQIPNFRGADGAFSRDTYEFEISRFGYEPAEFEAQVRDDTVRSILQVAVVGGVAAPDQVVDAITAFAAETRDFTIANLAEGDLADPLPAPTPDELQAHYEEFGDRFERPELRQITYAWLSPQAILDEVEIDEEALRGLYQDRADEFIRPERRLLERLVFPSLDEAEAAAAALEAGETDFDTLIAERGLSLDDVDLGDVAAEDLAPAAAEAVFADPEAEIVGPAESVFGPALFRINAVLNATEITFEEARADLRAELAEAAARRAITAEREPIDDLLAGGATLEELPAETAMELGVIEFGPDSEDGIAGYDAFRAAALDVQDGDFPELLELSDGGLFALRLDAVIPPALPPLAEIEDEVAADWQREAVRTALSDRADALLREMATSGESLEELGLATTEETAIRRQDFVPDAPPTLVGQVFGLGQAGDMVVISGPDAAYLVRLDQINSAYRGAEDTAALRDLVARQMAQGMAADVFELFGQAMQAEAGIEINQAMINAVHAQFP